VQQSLFVSKREEITGKKEKGYIMRSFVIYNLHQIKFYLGDQIKEDEIYSSVCRFWS
jgi:hypothetical protein